MLSEYNIYTFCVSHVSWISLAPVSAGHLLQKQSWIKIYKAREKRMMRTTIVWSLMISVSKMVF